MSKKGIDVSKWNGDIDWKKVKADGIDFAMVREGFGMKSPKQVDKKFKQNIDGAKAVGLPVGVYHYSYATSVNNAKLEAQFCLENIKGYQLEYPVVFDIEDNYQRKLTKRQRTNICKAFCEEIENAGYYAMIYCNLDWWNNYFYKDELQKYDLWLAHWKVNEPGAACGIWQKSDEGKVKGIIGNVDLNIAYKDYPAIMKNKGLNGFKKEPVKTQEEKQTIVYVVKEGDTLWDISKKYIGNGPSYVEIKSLNNLKSDTILPGQKLKIKI